MAGSYPGRLFVSDREIISDERACFPIQVKVMENFHANGQPLEWHYFHFGNHGFASTESDGYQPYLADLAWPLVTEFLRRELIGPAL